MIVFVVFLVQFIGIRLAPGPAAMNESPHPAISRTPAVTGIPEHAIPLVTTPGNLIETPNLTRPVVSAGTSLPTTIQLPESAVEVPVITGTGTAPVPDHEPATGSGPEVTGINTTSLAFQVHELVNTQRQKQGVPALGMDTSLAALALAHSQDMAKNGYFGHVNLQEMDPTARGAAAGYLCRKDYDTFYTYGIAENIFATCRYGSVVIRGSQSSDYDWKNENTIANETVGAWMKSPEHHANILEKGMLREGIGVAVGSNDLVFVTEDFC